MGLLIARPWLTGAFDDWSAGADPVLLVIGGLGIGKSEALRAVADGRDVLYAHFCRDRDDSTLNPVRLVERLVASIAQASPDYARAVAAQEHVELGSVSVTTGTVGPGAIVTPVWIDATHVSAREAFDRFVRVPWQELTPARRPRQWMVVVDALDESRSWPGSETVATLMASIASAPPDGMRFLAATRPLPEVLRLFPGVRRLDLDAHRGELDDDVLRYAQATGARDPEAVVTAAEGNLLVAYYGGRGGLDEVYRSFLDRERIRAGKDWHGRLRSVLAAVAVLRGPGATAGDLAALLDIRTPEALSALADLGSFVRRDVAGRWSPYHQSFRTHIIADEEIGSGPEQDFALARRMVELFGADWWNCEMPYAVEHVAGHLLSALDGGGLLPRRAAELLDDLVSDGGWLVRRSASGSVDTLLAEMTAASRSSTAAGGVLGLVRHVFTRLQGSASPAVTAQQFAVGAVSSTAPELRESIRSLARDLGGRFADPKWSAGPHAAALRLVISAHDGAVNRLCVSPDRNRMLSVGADGWAKLWDWATGALLASTPAVVDGDVAWSTGIAYLVGEDGWLRAWDPVTERCEKSLISATAVWVNADGRRLVVASDTSTTLRDAIAERVILALPGGSVAVSADRTSIAVLVNGVLHTGDDDGNTWHEDVDLDPSTFWTSVGMSPDGSLVSWTAYGDRAPTSTIEVRDVEGLRRRFRRTFDPPAHACLDARLGRVVVTTDDAVVRVYDLVSGAMTFTRAVFTGYLHTMVMLATGSVLGGCSTGRAYLVPTDPATDEAELPVGSGVSALAVTSDERVVLAGRVDGNIGVCDVDLSTEPLPEVTGFALVPGGRRMWVSDPGGPLRQVDTTGGAVLVEHDGIVGRAVVHGGDERTVVLTVGGEVVVLDAATGAVRHRWSIDSARGRALGAWRSSAGWLVQVESGTSVVLRTESGAEWPYSLPGSTDVRPVGADAVLVVSYTEVVVLDIRTGEVAARFPVRAPIVNSYAGQYTAVSGDGSTAVVNHEEGLVQLDLVAGRPRLLLPAAGPTSTQRYGPDAVLLDHSGAHLVTASRTSAAVHRIADMAVVHRLDYRAGHVLLAMSEGPGDQFFCVASSTGDVFVRDVLTGQMRWSFGLDSALRSVAFADAATLVGLDEVGRLVVFGLG